MGVPYMLYAHMIHTEYNIYGMYVFYDIVDLQILHKVLSVERWWVVNACGVVQDGGWLREQK